MVDERITIEESGARAVFQEIFGFTPAGGELNSLEEKIVEAKLNELHAVYTKLHNDFVTSIDLSGSYDSEQLLSIYKTAAALYPAVKKANTAFADAQKAATANGFGKIAQTTLPGVYRSGTGNQAG